MKEAVSLQDKRGQMMSRVITVVVGTILVVGVGIPIAQDVISDANLSGIAATIVTFIPVFMAVGGLILATRLFS